MDVNRRNFIKKGSAVVAGSMILPSFMQSYKNLQSSESVKNYLDHFEVSAEMLQKVVATAMSKGGDYADLFFEHKISNNISLEDRKVNRAFSNVDFGVGIRVLKGDQTGFAYSENVSLEDMLSAAKMAASIANDKSTFKPMDVTEKSPSSYYKIAKQWDDVSVKDKVPFVQKINDMIFLDFDESDHLYIIKNANGKNSFLCSVSTDYDDFGYLDLPMNDETLLTLINTVDLHKALIFYISGCLYTFVYINNVVFIYLNNELLEANAFFKNNTCSFNFSSCLLKIINTI